MTFRVGYIGLALQIYVDCEQGVNRLEILESFRVRTWLYGESGEFGDAKVAIVAQSELDVSCECRIGHPKYPIGLPSSLS